MKLKGNRKFYLITLVAYAVFLFFLCTGLATLLHLDRGAGIWMYVLFIVFISIFTGSKKYIKKWFEIEQ